MNNHRSYVAAEEEKEDECILFVQINLQSLIQYQLNHTLLYTPHTFTI